MEISRIRHVLIQIIKRSLLRKRMPIAMIYTAVDIPEIKRELESQNIKHRNHPGKRSIKRVTLPDQLVNAAHKLLVNHNRNQLLTDSKKLNNILQSRKLPAEEAEIRNTSKVVEAEVLSKANMTVDSINNSEDKMKTKIKNQILSRLRRKIHCWKPIDYDRYDALLYLTRRLAPEYASLTQVFTEIKHYDPNFTPEHVFDFGSGVGSVLWVAHALWGQHIKDYFCVDTSSHMITIAELLLQGGTANAEMFLKGVYFRQFLPYSNSVMYDLVVSSYSLMELPSTEQRLQVVDTLWKKCNKYLVIVEFGSHAGYTAVIEARDYILKLEANGDGGTGAHVIAPCPHDLNCPRFMDGTNTPCNFEISYHELPFDHRMSVNTERFSYVILKKEPRSQESKEPWPRIVREVLPRSRHVVCRMCCPDGKLHEIIFTKCQHGRHLYRCARSSRWGDMIPTTISIKSETVNLTEETEDSS